MKAERLANAGELFEREVPGAFVYTVSADETRNGMIFRCPGCCAIGSVRFGPEWWTFSGTDDEPTLHPSVHESKGGCGWHGWLRSGVWVSA